MALHRIGTRKPLAGSGSAADRLVVLAIGIAKAQVVHRALGGRQRPHRGKQGIGHRLGGLNIPRHHSGWGPGVQQTAFRHHQFQGIKTAGIQGNRLLH